MKGNPDPNRSRIGILLSMAVALAAGACAKKSEEPAPPPEPAAVQAGPRPRFYYDLGPAAVDVSGYPARQRENYAVFLSVCGSCHTTARALNAPHAEAATWGRFVRRMHVKMQSRGIEPSQEDMDRILEFLVHDSKARKTDKAAEFQASQEALKKSFQAASAP